jgi:hypothetical protein
LREYPAAGPLLACHSGCLLAWKGDVLAVERYVRQFRTADVRARAARSRLTAPAAPPALSPARRPAGIMARHDNLAGVDTADLARLPALRWPPPQPTSAGIDKILHESA